MSTIQSVTVPDQVKFGTAFPATINYTLSGPTRVDITPLAHVSVAPTEFTVDPSGTATVNVTLTDGNAPSKTIPVMIQFTLGASQFTVPTIASP